MSWFIPYNQLDNEQLSFLQRVGNSRTKNFWLQGYAGSGKSVLLIHCLLKEKERNPASRVIIVLFTHALIDMIRTGIPSEYKNTPIVTYHKFRTMTEKWDLILVDEVQDLPEQIVTDIESRGTRVIVAGDVNQSIYDKVCPTEKIENILRSQSFPLGIIHRISRRIRQVAQFFCADRAGFNASSIGGMVERIPTLVNATTKAEEYQWLLTTAKEYAQTGYAPAILIPRHVYIFEFLQNVLKLEGKPLMPNGLSSGGKENYNSINEHLKRCGLKFQYLGNGAGSLKQASLQNLVSVMTYHSAKGLDFKAVFIPFLTPELEIWKDDDTRSRTLFFVALTRSREQLFLSYHGKTKHRHLAKIPDADFYSLSAASEIQRMSNPLGGVNDDDEPLVVF
jgi:hypothetical protein